MYNSSTRSISVTVEPYYLEEQSTPELSHYVWAYKVVIHNKGKEIVQVKSRYWRITDSNGKIQEIEGEGVVGEQPVIKPGEKFEYASGAPLTTPSGIMAGSYQIISNNGEVFNVAIPAFSLDCPDTKKTIN